MPAHFGLRRVVVLAPMPLELDAIVSAFGLTKTGDNEWTAEIGGSAVTAVHIGMGPPLTRAAASRLLDAGRVDHMMIAGICGGLHPDLPVGTLINPEIIVDHTSGNAYRHTPPGDAPQEGKLVTTEGVSLDHDLSRKFFADGFYAVDMESATVGEVCSSRAVPWSVYRCIGDRWFDGLLDERLVAMTNPDGSGNRPQIEELLAADPDLARRLDQLSKDTSMAAQRAAEAAVRGCVALDR